MCETFCSNYGHDDDNTTGRKGLDRSEKAVEEEKAKGGKSPLSEESLAIFIFNQTIISSFGSGGILDFIPYKLGDGA